MSELDWKIVAGLITAVWTITTVFRDQRSQTVAHSHEIMSRLFAADQVSIDHPEIHKYLAATATEPEEYFRASLRLNDELYLKSKAYLYMQLNLFDEILSVAAHGKFRLPLFRSPQILELSDWEQYMKHTMAHPLCRAILSHEHKIFGTHLQVFWNEHKTEIRSRKLDQFSW